MQSGADGGGKYHNEKEDTTYSYLVLQLGRSLFWIFGFWIFKRNIFGKMQSGKFSKLDLQKCRAENFQSWICRRCRAENFQSWICRKCRAENFKVGFAENFPKIKKMKNLKIFFGNKNMSLGCFGEEMNKRWRFMTTEEIEEDFRETMKGWSKCNQEMKRNRRFPRLVIEHLQTGEEWVTNEEEAESFVGRTLEGVGDYYIVEGEEYIIYELE